MLFRQNIIEFTNIKETLEEIIILEFKFGRKRKNRKLVRSLAPWGLNKIIVGTDRRLVLRTVNGISHEITYTGPLTKGSVCLISNVFWFLNRKLSHSIKIYF